VIGSTTALTGLYDVALLDLDGVIYIGEQPVAQAPAALATARRDGMRLAFVTNNASRTPDQVARLLSRMGVAAAPEEVVTSSHAAAHYLADRLPAGGAVLVLGTDGLVQALKERGLTPVFSADDEPLAVAQGYSPELNWHALAEGAVAIRRGAMYVATNLDSTVPSARGPLPGNGALVAALVHATGVRPTATGKPDPTMHAESVQRSKAQRPLVVGDRLDTDIEGARRVGCPSLLVLTGVTDARQVLAAGELHRPDYLGHDLSALLTSHPDVSVDAGVVRCGRARVEYDADGLSLRLRDTGDGGTADHADGDGLDPLRALAVAAWRRADEKSGTAGSIAGEEPAEVTISAGDDAAKTFLSEHALMPIR